MTWPAERVARAHALRRRGLSFTKIAAAMGGGVTRQAVQGRLARDYAKARPKPVPAVSSAARERLARFDPILRPACGTWEARR